MEVIQLDEDSDDEIDEIQKVINIQSDQDSNRDEEALEILVGSDIDNETVVFLDDTSTDNDDNSRDVEFEEEVHIESSNSCQEYSDLLSTSTCNIEKTDDNAVDVDLFAFEEVVESPDNFDEGLNTFDYQSETVDELREIVSSDEDDTKFGDVLSEQLLSSPEPPGDITRHLGRAMFWV